MKYSSASEKAAIVPRKMVRTFVASDAEIPKIKRKLVISVSIELVRTHHSHLFSFNISVCHDDLSDLASCHSNLSRYNQ